MKIILCLFATFACAALDAAPLLHEPFSSQSAGNLSGQVAGGTGFATAATWTGLNAAFGSTTADASTLVAGTGLVWGDLVTNPNFVRVKGDGSNTRAMLDVSATGPFAAAGLVDAATNTIGGGAVQGTLYVSFLFRAVSTDRNSEYGGLQLARTNSDQTGMLLGNGWNPWAYSVYIYPSTNIDLKENGGTGAWKDMNTQTRLVVARIDYKANAADHLTVWVDPDLAAAETDQNFSGVYMGSADGDFSFDRMFLRGGNATHQFEYDEIRMGTEWADVTPLSSPPLVLQNANLKASVRADGSLSRLQANRNGVWEEIPFRGDTARGPAWQVTTGGTATSIPLARDPGLPSFTGSFGGQIFKLAYSMDSTALRVTARVENPTGSAWSPTRASLCLGINSYMDGYPAWNERYFPTMLRCEKSHFWGYSMSPLGRILGYTVADPVASWHHDYENGQHRIRTTFLDLLQSGPLPARHPQDANNIAAGAAREWHLSLMDIATLDAAPATLAAASVAPVIQADRYQGVAGDVIKFTVHGGLTTLTADGSPLAFAAAGTGVSAAEWTLPATTGNHTIVATNAAGQSAECLVVTRRPWSWYLQQARAEAVAKPQKASSHTESWYGLYSGYLARRYFPDAGADAAIDAKFNEIFPLMYSATTGLPTSWQDRIQNHSAMAGVLVDRYQATGDITSLERASAICDFLMTKQHADGGYYNGSTHYTSVIYIAKSIMEVMAEEKKLGDAGNSTWQTRYANHYNSVKRAMDDLVARGANVQTEGQQTYEDGMISCSYTQLAQFALLQTDPIERAKYSNAAIALANGHRCLSQKIIPDGRLNGGSLRFWEAQYDVLARASNMMCSPHGWSAWRLYGLRSLYELTGDPAYLRDAMNGLGSCAQIIDPGSGQLRWAFVVDPSVSAGVFTEFPANPGKGRCVPTTLGEQYLPMISGWYRAPANTWVTGYWGGLNSGSGLGAGETWPQVWTAAYGFTPVWGGDGGCCDNDVHEIFKCLGEIALDSAYAVLHPDGSTETWNCSATTVGDTLVLTPAESVVGRVHVNHLAGSSRKTAVRFGDQLVNAAAAGSAWVDRPTGDSAYHLWRTDHFGDGYALDAKAMDAADPDGDGLVNRIEFLLQGGDPLIRNTRPVMTELPAPDAGWFEFAIDRNTAASPAMARIEASFNLSQWFSLPIAGNSDIVVTEDSPARHAARVRDSLPEIFLRVAGD